MPIYIHPICNQVQRESSVNINAHKLSFQERERAEVEYRLLFILNLIRLFFTSTHGSI